MPFLYVPYLQEKRLLYIFAGQRGTEFLRYSQFVFQSVLIMGTLTDVNLVLSISPMVAH